MRKCFLWHPDTVWRPCAGQAPEAERPRWGGSPVEGGGREHSWDVRRFVLLVGARMMIYNIHDSFFIYSSTWRWSWNFFTLFIMYFIYLFYLYVSYLFCRLSNWERLEFAHAGIQEAAWDEGHCIEHSSSMWFLKCSLVWVMVAYGCTVATGGTYELTLRTWNTIWKVCLWVLKTFHLRTRTWRSILGYFEILSLQSVKTLRPVHCATESLNNHHVSMYIYSLVCRV